MPLLLLGIAAALQSSPVATPAPAPPATCPVKTVGGGEFMTSYFADADYPPEAAAAGQEGTVCFRVTIGTDGRVRACDIVVSSGSASLDATTCRLAAERFRFRPALSASGAAVEDHMVTMVTWRLSPRTSRRPRA